MTELSIVDAAFDSVGTGGSAALDAIVGGTEPVAESTKPRARRGRATQPRRRRSSTTAPIVAAADEMADTAALSLPERLLVTSLRTLRSQAARRDQLGEAARTLLGALHGTTREAARFFTRIERETAPPTRRTRRTTPQA